MPNTVGPDGITIQTYAEILDYLNNGTTGFPGFLQIYPGANTAPNSPDGQMLALWSQAALDYLELTKQAASSFDPDQAVGVLLDQRCAINGVVRNAGSFTTVDILVTVTQALSLAGTSSTNTFTVSDSTGNQYQLLSDYSFLSAGSATLGFQAVALGPLNPLANTITVIVTTMLGVASVNNPSTATTVGTTEESDFSLRIRRARSVSLPSQGYWEGLYGALSDVVGVTSVVVLENDTASTDADGIPSHSIWVLIAGGDDDAIADVIYRKRNAGCGMKGTTTVTVTRVNGSTFDVKFQRPTSETLWISFNLTAISGTFDAAYVRAQLLAALSYDIGQGADTSTIVSALKIIAPNCYVDSEGVSNTNGSYTNYKATTAVNYQWATASVRVLINGVPGT